MKTPVKSSNVKEHSRVSHLPIISRTIHNPHFKSEEKFELYVDMGKPYTEILTKEELKKELKRLRKMFENNEEDYPYFDLTVSQGNRDLSGEEIDEIEFEGD